MDLVICAKTELTITLPQQVVSLVHSWLFHLLLNSPEEVDQTQLEIYRSSSTFKFKSFQSWENFSTEAYTDVMIEYSCHIPW